LMWVLSPSVLVVKVPGVDKLARGRLMRMFLTTVIQGESAGRCKLARGRLMRKCSYLP
jgi:hypothetical protein